MLKYHQYPIELHKWDFFSGRPFCPGGDLTAAEWDSDFAEDLFSLYSNLTELILVDPVISYNPVYENREELLKKTC